MIKKNENCPFREGDQVIYRPSKRGFDLEVMSSTSDKLIPGKLYKIKNIQNKNYVLVEDYQHPGGGIYWTEFEKV
jgi:hypothetical protein